RNRVVAFGVASALAMGAAATASAGPLPVNSINGPTHATEVAWRGHGWHGHGWGPAVGIGAGLAAGALIGSAVAAQPYGYYYGEPGYVYGAPYAYDVGPTYYGYSNWGYGPCYTNDGYGRRSSCDR